MLLAVDVGNTNIVFGLFENDKLVETFRISTKKNRTSDELGLLLLQYFDRVQLTKTDIEATVIASVVPQVMPVLSRAFEKYLGNRPLLIDKDLLPQLYYHAEGALGADRSVCCEAALHKYGAPLIVLDLGTATTIDAVGVGAHYLGGCILAGMQVSADALYENASQLPLIPLERPKTFLGYNTVEQIQIGAVSGYIGAIAYLLQETKQEMEHPEEVKVIATGGFAPLLAGQLSLIHVVDEHLVLDGLRILYERSISKENG